MPINQNLYASVKPPTNEFLKGLAIWSLGEQCLLLQVNDDNVKDTCFSFSVEKMIETIKSQRSDADAIAAIDCLITSEVENVCFPKSHLLSLEIAD